MLFVIISLYINLIFNLLSVKNLLLTSFAILLFSCGAPKSFVKTGDGSWTSVPIRSEIEKDRAWDEAVDILARKFEMEMLNRESKYARTGWVYNWNKKGAYTQKYRVRATIKLSPSGENLDIKSEAQYGGQSGWKSGFDDRLLQTLKSDISGVIGRVAR